MDLLLTGKRALVTGGSRGIGKAIARTLAEEGCDVAVAARDPGRLATAVEELRAATGRRIVGIPVDTGDDDSVRSMVAAAVEGLGGVDILVNNAARPGGQSAPPTLATLTRSDLFDEVEVKVMGYLRCAQAVAPQMIERGWGRIVNVSGLAARSTGSIVGSIRNVAVAAMTKNLADELGRHGITVTVVHPGLTRTEATPAVMAARAAAAGVDAATIEARMAQGNAIKRIVDADEVAAVVAFLASPRAAAITGDAVACGGGQPGPIFY